MTRALHIVQIGYDDSVFRADAPSDTLERQLWYGKILDQKRPGSSMKYLILTSQQGLQPFQRENVMFFPVPGTKLQRWGRLWKTLSKLQVEKPIDVLSPQDVNEMGWLTLLFGRVHEIPVVGQIHYDIFSPYAQTDVMGRGFIGWIRKRLTFLALPKFFALRVVGRAIKKQLISHGLSHNVHVIPVPVTMIETASPSYDAELSEHPRITFVGKLYYPKNLPFWLDVARIISDKNPRVEFEIVGDGPLAQALKTKSGQLGLTNRVRFRGNLPYKDLSEIYRQADLFMLTSYYEGFGRVLVEAYAHGVPVIAPRITGVEDIIEDGKTGILCEPGNAHEMAEKALNLIEQKELRLQMGQEGRKRVMQYFDPPHLAEAWINCLISVASTKTTIPPLRATWKRWLLQSSTKYSILRGLEYECITGLRLCGRTLDVGGGQINSYSKLLELDGQVESVNISLDIQPTIICDLNQPLPIRDDAYDNLISLNTFEHIEKDEIAIREAFRVLKSGGAFHIIVPFLYRVHGSPSDYHRHTAYWWTNFLQSLGIEIGEFSIEPLVWDPRSSGFAVAEYAGRFRGLRKKTAMFPAVLRQILWFGQQRLPQGWTSEHYAEFALGYHIYGRK
jgi:glycosyltransferase involved in cell wall biosynthesis